jgi:glycosyltransferase involved in cell wall biosynthesis
VGKHDLATPFIAQKVEREGAALRQLPVIVAASRCTLDDTLAHYGLTPSIREIVVNPLRAEPGLPLWDLDTCDRKALLFVGRFDEIKGADLLLQAYRRLLVAHPDLKLVFVGPDYGLTGAGGAPIPMQEYVRSLGDPALERGLSYRGRLTPADVAALRPTAFATIVSSRRETQCYTGLEAMLQGCPLVCTDTTGLSEMVEHGVTGLKARPEDPADLAAQVERLLESPALAQAIAQAGRQHVLRRHAPGLVTDQLIDLYHRTIALHRVRGGRLP